MYPYLLVILLQFHVAKFTATADESCSGGFDVYFVLDRSTSVSKFNFQNQTVQFVQNIVSHLTSPKLRASVIVFSDQTEVILPLTGSRKKIKSGINDLKRINPGGTTYILEALIKVQKSIENKGANTASVLILLTDGTLYDKEQSIQKTSELKRLGTTIFAVGVEGFKLNELQRLSSSPPENHVFTARNYDALQQIAEAIINKACVEITEVRPKFVCERKPTDITLEGKGFSRTYDKSLVKCSFHFNETYQKVIKATEVSDRRIKCGPIQIDTSISNINVRVTLNGKTFVSSDQFVEAKLCKKANIAPIVLIILGLITFIFVFLSWWFWFILPCVKEPQKKEKPLLQLPSPTEKSPPQSPTKKWDTVDTSYYGGGGVGGIKSVRVKWGDKGATEAGNKLTQTPDAKVISKTSTSTPIDEERNNNNQQSSNQSIFSRFKNWIVGLFNSLSKLRPRKHGISKFYSKKYER